jgi:hypothetical protein
MQTLKDHDTECLSGKARKQLTGALSIAILAVPLLFSGCQRAYYTLWETLGKEKRHLLKDNVEKARTEQEEASAAFKDVLSRVKELYDFEGGDLEEFYQKLRADYEMCEGRAQRVGKRIEQVEQIASDLFREWEAEITQMTNEALKSRSSRSLDETRLRYARLSNAMTKAEASMEPVLLNLRDYVFFLKHNLNARAIGVLKKEVDDIEMEVGVLIEDMTASIEEAERFLRSLD